MLDGGSWSTNADGDGRGLSVKQRCGCAVVERDYECAGAVGRGCSAVDWMGVSQGVAVSRCGIGVGMDEYFLMRVWRYQHCG